MANMSLGSYEFARNPSIYAQPELVAKQRHSASVETYSSLAFFSWGLSVAGKTITLEWQYLPDSQYSSLRAILEADDAVVFDPQDGSNKTYTVEVLSVTGKYHYKLAATSTTEDVWRKDVAVELLILAEVVGD